jgi:hypothetical protein
MQLNKMGMLLLKHIMSYSGEKEVNDKGIEVASLRRLDTNEKSCQRGILMKKLNAEIEKVAELEKKLVEKMKTWWKENNPKNTDEKDNDYEARMINALNIDESFLKEAKEISETKYEIEVDDKVKKLVKECFDDFGKKGGWAVGDDEMVAELTELLK